MSKIQTSLKEILSKTTDEIHRHFFGQEWDGDRNKIYNTKMFKILKHNYLFLPNILKMKEKELWTKLINLWL